jgi:3-dehydroquinate synthetase
MVLEARLGEKIGVTRPGTSDTLRKLATLMDLPVTLPAALEPETVLGFTRADKKGRGGRPQYVLLSQTGKVASGEDWAQEVPDEIVLEVLRDPAG